MMKKIIAICIACFVAGCASKPTTNVSSPAIDTPSVASVGDAIYRYEYMPSVTTDIYNRPISIDGEPVGFGGPNDVFKDIKTLVYGGVANEQIILDFQEQQQHVVGKNANGQITKSGDHRVQYDLRPGETISYRGLKIRILNADNNEIAYVVEKGLTPQ